MSNSEQEYSKDENPIPEKKKLLEGEEEFIEEMPANLGLDADRSSDNDSVERRNNLDNDITSDSSKDNSDHLQEPFDSSPIMNK
jgi:hypothetical protein